jgi:hypothetical protein
MTAKLATDAWGWDVEYYFDAVSDGGHDSGWQFSRSYTDTGLIGGRRYGYRVKARDGLGNETGWSPIRFAGTVDNTPPTPEPIIETADPNSSQDVILTAKTAFDDNGVQYYFEFDPMTPGAHDSGWIDVPTYNDANLAPATTYRYRVRARDLSPNLNMTGWSPYVSVTTDTPPNLIAPTPNPMQFDPNAAGGGVVEFYGTGGDLDWWVELNCVEATDDGGGDVQYKFVCLDDDRYSSPWLNTTTWQVQVGRPNHGWKFIVLARDEYGNTTIRDESLAQSAPIHATN